MTAANRLMKALCVILPAALLAIHGTAAAQPQVAPPADGNTFNKVLYVMGYQVEHAPKAGEMMQKREEMCAQWGPAIPVLTSVSYMAESEMAIGMADMDPGLAMMIRRIEVALQMAGIDVFEDFRRHLFTVQDALCDDLGSGWFGHFAITYAHCRMTMYTPTHSMDIHMPPGSPAAYMLALDHSTQEGVRVDLARDLAGTLPVTGAGWSSGINMVPTGATQEYAVNMTPSGNSENYQKYMTREYTYEYKAGMGGLGTAPGFDAIASKISVDNTGTAWVAANVEGESIPRRFYWNLATQVQPAEGMTSYFSGMIQNLVGMLQHGLPLYVESKVTSRIMGKSVLSGDSQSLITGLDVRPMPAGFCEQSYEAPEFEITNVSEQLDQMMGQEGMPSQDEMSAAMQQMNEAMASMTPEQKEMMASMGLSDIMGMGAAGAGSANPQTASKPAASAPAPAVQKGSQDSLSTALQGTTLTETAKNYLQVLGYDTGDAGGETNLETTIAISQFQAENNMKATGEVSPQLIGLLAAKVDAL